MDDVERLISNNRAWLRRIRPRGQSLWLHGCIDRQVPASRLTSHGPVPDRRGAEV